MATGYTRTDTANNIATGNIINASDFDNEFDAIQSAMDVSTGHNHDGTVGGGAPIAALGPAQDVVITASAMRPKTDNTVDLGTSSLEFKDLYLDGTANIDTLQVDESATITANLTVSGNATITTNLTVNGNTVLGNANNDTLDVKADFISDLVPNTDDTYDLGLSTNEWRNLYIDGTAQVDTLQVDESATITANLTVNGDTTLGNAAGDTVTFTARVASNLVPSVDGGYDLGSSDKEWKDLYITGTAQVDSLQVDASATITNNLTVSNNATITANLTVNGNTVLGNANNDTLDVKADFISSLVPNTDDTYDLGFTTNEWRDLYIDGIANIDTLQVDESATITANLTVSGNATISTNLTVNGDTTLGNAEGDTVTVTARVASNLVPSTDGAYDLGSSDKEWKDLYITGTAQVDSLQVDASATITANLTVNGDTTLGNTTADTVTFTARAASNFLPSVDDTYDLGSSGKEWKDLYITGTAQVDSLQVDDSATITANLTVNGDTTLGNTTADTVTFTARAASNFLPSVDGTYDLGSSGNEWQDLYIDGVARIDSLIADTVDINAGTAILSSAKVITANGGNVTVQRDDTSITSGEVLGVLDFQAPNVSGGGNAILVTAAVKAVADTTFDATNNKTSLVFQTANAGAVVTRVEVTGDGHVLPGTDDAYDLGASGTQWRNLWIDGTANIDDLVADTADINGGTIDGTTIGATTAAAGTFTNINATGGTITGITDLAVADGGTGASDQAGARTNLGLGTIATQDANSVTITGGSINGTTIGATTAAAGTFTSVTAPSVAITGGSINGTTIGATTAAAGTFTSVTAPSVAITGGSINGTTIGATTTSTIAGTTGTFSGAVTASNVVVSNGFVDTGATAGGTTIFLQGFRNDAGQSGGAVRIRSAGDGAGNAVQMIFDTNSSEAMRIGDGTTGAGASYLGLNGVNTPTAPLHVNGNARLEGANISLIFSETDTSDKDARVRLQGGNLLFETLNDDDTLNRLNLTLESGGSLILAGSTAQKATGTTWSNPSDQRLKSNITDYPKGIPELMQVRVCEWEYNGKGGTVEGMRGIGVIADEVMAVLPNTVETYDAKLNDTDEETTAIKKFDATEITWLLVKAVQEQQAIINSLEARLSALEAQ